MNRQVRLQISAGVDYMPKDTVVTLSRAMSVGISRNESYYGSVRFRLFHPDKVMAGCRVRIGQYEAISDERGCVSLDIPLENQKPAYPISAEVPLVDKVLTMPNNSSTAIEVKL